MPFKKIIDLAEDVVGEVAGLVKSGANAIFPGDSYEYQEAADDAFADVRRELGTAQETARDQFNEATAEAEAQIAEAVAQATWFLEQGEKKGAAAAIEGARKAADAIMKSADQGESAVREFWNKANEALAPVVRQGNFGRDEMASMLGVPNARGELVPFNAKSLSETPGYRFKFNEGQRALENSAVGTALSGAQVKGSIEFGQGLASEYFNKRVDQLGLLAQMGLTASQSQAQAATQAGANISQLRSNAGGQLGNAYTGEATSLANIYQQTGAAQSNNYMTAGSAMSALTQGKGMFNSQLTTDLATTNANLTMSEYMNRQSIARQKQAGKFSLDDAINISNAVAAYVPGTNPPDPIKKQDPQKVDVSGNLFR